MNETKPGQTPADVSFQVMPHGNQPSVSASNLPQAPSGHRSSKTAYIIIAVIVVLLLGGLAYYFLGVNKPAEIAQTNGSKLPQSFMSQYFAKDTCDDQATCGDTADPDTDGLNNYDEFVAGTSPVIADSDTDGLADGDEQNIYGTSPKNKYSDTRAIAAQNDFNDGASIRNGYDPTTPGVKYTQTKSDAIKAKIDMYHLHAPSTTTLGLNSDGTSAGASNGTSVNPAAGGVTPSPTGTPDGKQ
jgi:hypothetical protein